MGIVRNNINIEGIIQEEELFKNEKGHTIIYSDAETLFIPINNPDIKSIYEIIITIDIVSNRAINTPIGKIVVLDGVKKHKILYTENTDSQKMSILHLDTPFNTFTEAPYDLDEFWNVKVNIIDAYFSMIDSRKIYSHFLYLLDVYYEKNNQKTTLSNKIGPNTYSETLNNPKPFKNMFEELSISEDTENQRGFLLDIDEEIL